MQDNAHSDNGTNFRGAATELDRLFSEASFSQEVAEILARDQVEQPFILARSPSIGGLWETNIKSFKHHLYRAIGEAKLTYEEFSTVCAPIDACLNSRPLSDVSEQESGVNVLTPGNFLIGNALLSPAELFANENLFASRS